MEYSANENERMMDRIFALIEQSMTKPHSAENLSAFTSSMYFFTLNFDLAPL